MEVCAHAISHRGFASIMMKVLHAIFSMTLDLVANHITGWFNRK